MPKVLRIINRFNLGGPTYNAAYLTKYLPDDFETLLIGGDIDESEAGSNHILDELGLKPIVIPEMRRAIRFGNDYAAYKKIKEIILEFKPDIVHTHASKAGTLGRLAAFSCKVPVVIHTFHGHVFHSYFNKVKTAIFKSIERKLAKKCACIVAISDNQKQELGVEHQIAPLDKIRVIPLGFDLSKFRYETEIKREFFRKAYNIKHDEIAIGIIGRLVPVKNHELFLRAFKIVLLSTTKKVRALIIGDGEDRVKIVALAKELGIKFCTDNFEKSSTPLIFTSWIKEIDHVNAGIDIVALSSLNEGTPVSLIEAQAANNPIVSTNVGGIEDIMLNNRTGLLSELGDINHYAQNLLSIIEDEQLMKKMQTEGWEYVKNKFSHQRLVKDMSKLYYELLSTNKV